MSDSAPQLPFDRPGVLTISHRYEELRAEAPAVRVRTPAGDPAWLLTRYAEHRQLWSDPRLGRSHPNPEQAARVSEAAVLSGPTGDYETEHADHAMFRKLLTPAFSAKRMRRLEEHITTLVHGMIDDLLAAGGAHGPADLHAHLSVPLPVFVICELLGVPFDDRHYFKGLSERMATMSGARPEEAFEELAGYVGKISSAKRAQPGEDLISDLIAVQRDYPNFDDDSLARFVAIVLFAGHETTVNRINSGVLLLLDSPDARQRLIDDPATAPEVVEEILRLSAPGGVGVVRYAHQDFTVGEPGEEITIRRGEAVLLHAAAANRDAAEFADAAEFDPTRKPNPHLAFGHGAYFCIGASLARTELRAVFETLFQRLPNLALAVDPAELVVHTDRVTGGLESLPVTW